MMKWISEAVWKEYWDNFLRKTRSSSQMKNFWGNPWKDAGKISKGIPIWISLGIPWGMLEGIPGGILETISEVISQGNLGKISEEILERISFRISRKKPWRKGAEPWKSSLRNSKNPCTKPGKDQWRNLGKILKGISRNFSEGIPENNARRNP